MALCQQVESYHQWFSSYFLTLKSKIRHVYSNTKQLMKPNHIPNTLVNTARARSSE